MPHTKLRILRRGALRYEWLHHGRAGNVQTLREMAALVREDLETDVGLANYANSILLAAKVAGDVRGRSMKEVAAIFYFVRNRFIFRRDPTGGMEAIQDARATIERGFGDCDDFSVLLATLLGLVGYPTRFVVIRINPKADGFQHVYTEVLDPDETKWHALDATNPKALVGWEARSIERRTCKIFGSQPDAEDDLEGFKSFFKKIGSGIKKVAKVAAPVAAGLIPGVGQFAAQGVQMAIDAKSGKGQAQQQGPTGEFVKFSDSDTIYRVADRHAFSSWAEFVAAGGSATNVLNVPQPTPAQFKGGTAPEPQALPPASRQQQPQQPQQSAIGGIPAPVLIGGGIVALILLTKR
jgi:hypothetical protein